jgi:hypothetical protein
MNKSNRPVQGTSPLVLPLLRYGMRRDLPQGEGSLLMPQLAQRYLASILARAY